MNIKVVDTVVLKTDIAAHRLKKGDIGAVVQLYSREAIEVEFVTASGHSHALVTLAPSQIRSIGPRDIPAVRETSLA